MANDKILLTYIGADLLFVASGALLLVFALTQQVQDQETATLDNVAVNLLFSTCPLSGKHSPSSSRPEWVLTTKPAAIGNAVLIFVTFLLTLPAIVMPMTRGWLKFAGYLSVVCGLFTMIIGLTIWFETLRTRRLLSDIWSVQPATTQSLLQQKVLPLLPASICHIAS